MFFNSRRIELEKLAQLFQVAILLHSDCEYQRQAFSLQFRHSGTVSLKKTALLSLKVASELQTYFRSSLLSLRKTTSVFLSG